MKRGRPKYNYVKYRRRREEKMKAMENIQNKIVNAMWDIQEEIQNYKDGIIRLEMIKRNMLKRYSKYLIGTARIRPATENFGASKINSRAGPVHRERHHS